VSTVEDVADHIDHALKIAGIEEIAGPLTDWCAKRRERK
jgi:microsomal dipeptidase-like Zn-dependent dipeptidase